jgi:hypothetical protein
VVIVPMLGYTLSCRDLSDERFVRVVCFLLPLQHQLIICLESSSWPVRVSKMFLLAVCTFVVVAACWAVYWFFHTDMDLNLWLCSHFGPSEGKA